MSSSVGIPCPRLRTRCQDISLPVPDSVSSELVGTKDSPIISPPKYPLSALLKNISMTPEPTSLRHRSEDWNPDKHSSSLVT